MDFLGQIVLSNNASREARVSQSRECYTMAVLYKLIDDSSDLNSTCIVNWTVLRTLYRVLTWTAATSAFSSCLLHLHCES
jgi:hypothetical protein